MAWQAEYIYIRLKRVILKMEENVFGEVTI
jgi:hypothetical protein